ncbi:hypothetical protein SAMN05216327_101231 [Dyadobacter sp. SG02]|uniref:hypothetical protein n=1 Tax=Dyadobacter sp. SG02 TaxID=1855291 RepID=UPI0008C5F3E7|nr:hypothetical protein [Dyadobacter sp. SG02]SEI39827.1 hypothetical protein SAMN05216327_101231 [Dyadobacter sp. SG02]
MEQQATSQAEVTNPFSVELSFESYLQRVGLVAASMPADQLRETKRAFFGGYGDLLMTLEHDILLLPEDLAVEKIESMVNQVQDFWMAEASHASPELLSKAANAVNLALG